MGGTALRFAHNLPRFSEDLDFNAKKLSSSEFDELLNFVKTHLGNEGFKINVKRKDIYDVFSARVGFISVMNNFGLADTRGEDIVVKLKVNNPEWRIKGEAVAFSFFGFLFTALVMDKGSLMAEKSHALIHRGRGRDIYDVLFLLRLKFPLDKKMFLAKKIKGDPKKVLLSKFGSLKETECKKLARQLQPFLFNEDDIALVEKVAFYGQQLLKSYN